MEMAEFLAIRRVDEFTWLLKVTDRLITPGNFLFGGCGLAAGVVALESASERPTVWASAQYISFAERGAEVRLTTELLAVGRHVTQARASAFLADREILTVNAALGRGELAAPQPWLTMPHVPPPEDCPVRVMPRRFSKSIFEHLETRVALGRRFEDLDATPGSPVSALWARVPGHVEPSAATMAIFGDLVSGGATQPLGRSTMGRSLDNTIRVARLVPTEWVLCEIHMHALVQGFGQGVAYLWSQDGVLLATASQSISARFFDPEG